MLQLCAVKFLWQPLAIGYKRWIIILLGLALFLYNLGVLAYEQMIRLGSALSLYSRFLRQRLYLFFGTGGFVFLGQELAPFFWLGVLHLGLGVSAFFVGGLQRPANFIIQSCVENGVSYSLSFWVLFTLIQFWGQNILVENFSGLSQVQHSNRDCLLGDISKL